MLKKRLIHDPFLDEYLYNLIYKANRIQKDRFPAEYSGVFNSSNAAKRFVAKATMEQKLYFLSLLGIEWFMVVGNRKTAPKDLRNISDQFKKNMPAEAATLIAEKNIFIFSGEQFIDYLGLMASLDHHKNYSYNIEIQKTGYHVHKWQKAVKYNNYTEVSENKETYERVMSFASNLLLSSETIEANHLIKLSELHVLLFLYRKKHTYIAHERLFDYFGGFFKKNEITIALKRLREKQLAKMSAISEKKEYGITALGIDTLNSFIKKTLTINI